MSELKNIIQMYLDWCKTYRSKATTQDYAQFFKSFLQAAETYNDESIENFIKSEQAKGNSPITINTKLSALKSLGEWAYARHLIESDTFMRINLLPVTKNKKITALGLNTSEIMEMAHNKGNGVIAIRDIAIMNTFIVTGCRVSELIQMKITDVDFMNKEIKIRHGKGNKERIVSISDGCIIALQSYLEKIKNIDNPEMLLFLSTRPAIGGSRQMTRQAVYKVVKGITGGEIGCHKLRHLTATTMLNAGVAIDTVQEILGHSSINTTKIYAERNRQAKISAAASLGV